MDVALVIFEAPGLSEEAQETLAKAKARSKARQTERTRPGDEVRSSSEGRS